MGATYVESQVKELSGKQENVKFLIDSGATCSHLPKALWESFGLKPKRKLSFTLSVSTTVERAVSEAFVILTLWSRYHPQIEDAPWRITQIAHPWIKKYWHIANSPDETNDFLEISATMIHTHIIAR